MQRDEDRLHFVVQATGSSISPDDLAAIFEPFGQVGSSVDVYDYDTILAAVGQASAQAATTS